MDRRARILRFGTRLGVMLGCAALLLPLAIGSFLPVASASAQPVEEEESRSPVETTKVSVGAVHRQQDRRELPRPDSATAFQFGLKRQSSLARSCSIIKVPHAMDSHNGHGGPLIV